MSPPYMESERSKFSTNRICRVVFHFKTIYQNKKIKCILVPKIVIYFWSRRTISSKMVNIEKSSKINVIRHVIFSVYSRGNVVLMTKTGSGQQNWQHCKTDFLN